MCYEGTGALDHRSPLERAGPPHDPPEEGNDQPAGTGGPHNGGACSEGLHGEPENSPPDFNGIMLPGCRFDKAYGSAKTGG